MDLKDLTKDELGVLDLLKNKKPADEICTLTGVDAQRVTELRRAFSHLIDKEEEKAPLPSLEDPEELLSQAMGELVFRALDKSVPERERNVALGRLIDECKSLLKDRGEAGDVPFDDNLIALHRSDIKRALEEKNADLIRSYSELAAYSPETA